MDWDETYQSIKPNFIEKVWGLLKNLSDKGLIYEGEKTMMWDVVDATALAKHETVFKEVEDISVYIRFELQHTPNRYLIIWYLLSYYDELDSIKQLTGLLLLGLFLTTWESW